MAHQGMAVISQFLRESGFLTGSIEAQRRGMDEMAANAEPPEGCTIERRVLGGRPVERIVPVFSAEDRAVLYLHGGAYCLGSPATHRNLAGRLAAAIGCAVFTLDYRLGPEHPFPAAVDDGVAAAAALVAEGIPITGIALAGDSAGGGLVMAVLLARRRTGSELPAAAVCFSPWVDLTQSSDSYARLADVDPLVSKDNLDVMAAAYLGPADPRDELASPFFAADFAGLPPCSSRWASTRCCSATPRLWRIVSEPTGSTPTSPSGRR
ncbi:MAG: alpha/beta hydrolase fold domain-containing protein [Acidimicrobiales bacterium]